MNQQTFEKEFWAKVKKAGENECWEWQAALKPNGYGKTGNFGKAMYAHRVAYELTVGPIPIGMEAAHKCHNRKCVNPNHIIPMTHKDNVRHSAKAGRLLFQKNPELTCLRKLTRDQALQIRALYTGRRGQVKQLAKQFGVHRETIRDIRMGLTWKHL